MGWRSTQNPFDFDATSMPLAPEARVLEYSTRAYECGMALGESVAYILDLGIDRVCQHDLRLGGQLIDGLDQLGAQVLTPREPQSRAGIVTARFPGVDSADLVDRLKRAGIIVSLRAGAMRLSPHIFNDSSDIARALNALTEALAAGA